jgi:spore maturation protein CgeB
LIIADVGVEHRMPRREDVATRIARRLMARFEIAALKREVLHQCQDFRPDVVLFYKGWQFDADFIAEIGNKTNSVVNVFPDYSPHAFGPTLAKAMGIYDLVISTKSFHPSQWSTTYGYSNRCVCVPHGYDPELHFRDEISRSHDYDVVLVAGGRPEYYELVDQLISQPGMPALRVAIVGNGWEPIVARLPAAWRRFPAKFGASYVDWLRRGKIVIAPLHTRVVVDGVRQPGDVDTARTYELAAAHCFFIHRRTPFLSELYDEEREVPMFDDAAELAVKILHYLDHDDQRVAIAGAAHRRAVPAHSFDARADEIVSWLNQL